MSDNAIPTKGSTAGMDSIFQWQDYIVNTDDKEFKSFLEHCDCPFDIHVEEPCKEIDDKPITFDLVSHHLIRSWIGFQLLRFSIWLGNFRMTIKEKE